MKIILKHALSMLSSSIILIHNHPSGNPSPSHQDIAITKKIKEAGNRGVSDHKISEQIDHLYCWQKLIKFSGKE
ncbi:MAG: JAB domain-containing protein [Bacteroidota bacterium]|nr:JAB domain-containing protein [Bacteroidota bacterium]